MEGTHTTGSALAALDTEAFFQAVGRAKLPSEALGVAYELAERAVSEQVVAYRAARSEGARIRFFEAVCQQALEGLRREERPQVITDASGEGLAHNAAPGAYAPGADARPENGSLAREAWRLAHSTATGRMVDYLGWFERQQRGEALEWIAESLEIPAASVRTGVRRAKNRILELTNKLRYQQFARSPGELPQDLEPIVADYKRGDLVAMRRKLDAVAGAFGECPHWHLLDAWFHKAGDALDAAEDALREALVCADGDVVRAKVLNTYGNVLDGRGELQRARRMWQRAHALDGKAPVPLLNLLAQASERQDLADCQVYIQKIAKLRARKTLDAGAEAFVLQRLAENPELTWVRRTAVWRRGPARWLTKTGTSGGRGAALGRVATALMVLMVWAGGFLGQGCDQAFDSDRPFASLAFDVALEDGRSLAQLNDALAVLEDERGLVVAQGRLVMTPDGAALPLNVEDIDHVRGKASRMAVVTDEEAFRFGLAWDDGVMLVLGSDGKTYEGFGEFKSARTAEDDEPSDPDEEAGKDDYIRPGVDDDSRVGKDDYIRPKDGDSLSKDDYIHPGARSDDSESDDGDGD